MAEKKAQCIIKKIWKLKFPWSVYCLGGVVGHHASLTHQRSPVRTRAQTRSEMLEMPPFYWLSLGTVFHGLMINQSFFYFVSDSQPYLAKYSQRLIATYSTTSYGQSPLLATSKKFPQKNSTGQSLPLQIEFSFFSFLKCVFPSKYGNFLCIFSKKFFSIIRTGLFLVASVLQIAPKINYEIINTLGFWS